MPGSGLKYLGFPLEFRVRLGDGTEAAKHRQAQQMTFHMLSLGCGHNKRAGKKAQRN